jgi:hypothetical protein
VREGFLETRVNQESNFKNNNRLLDSEISEQTLIGEESIAIEINLNHLISQNFNTSDLNSNARVILEFHFLTEIQNKLD